MDITRQGSSDDAIVLRLAGVVVDDGRQVFDQAVLPDDDYARPIVVNLRDVTLLNSSGIGLLLRLQRSVKERGGKLVISNLSPQVRQAIDFMKLDKVLIIARDEQHAGEMLK